MHKIISLHMFNCPNIKKMPLNEENKRYENILKDFFRLIFSDYSNGDYQKLVNANTIGKTLKVWNQMQNSFECENKSLILQILGLLFVGKFKWQSNTNLKILIPNYIPENNERINCFDLLLVLAGKSNSLCKKLILRMLINKMKSSTTPLHFHSILWQIAMKKYRQELGLRYNKVDFPNQIKGGEIFYIPVKETAFQPYHYGMTIKSNNKKETFLLSLWCQPNDEDAVQLIPFDSFITIMRIRSFYIFPPLIEKTPFIESIDRYLELEMSEKKEFWVSESKDFQLFLKRTKYFKVENADPKYFTMQNPKNYPHSKKNKIVVPMHCSNPYGSGIIYKQFPIQPI